jgi:hypothetical protein
MQLLVSVANLVEARAALAGGADVIDAKDPAAGALGPVTSATLHEIHAAVSGARPVTAALGDAVEAAATERAARAATALGATLVKVGFAGVAGTARATELATAAVQGARSGSRGAHGVVVVAYADAERIGSAAPWALLDVASRAGARGVLLDTADKHGPGLRALYAPAALAAWVADAHARRLLVAVAGKLAREDLPYVRDADADVAGVRGAACIGGRTGRVDAARVHRLCAACVGGASVGRVALRALER